MFVTYKNMFHVNHQVHTHWAFTVKEYIKTLSLHIVVLSRSMIYVFCPIIKLLFH